MPASLGREKICARTGSDACDAVVAATDAVELKEAKVAVDLAGLLCTLWLRRRSVDADAAAFTGDGSCDAPPRRTTPTTSKYADSLRAVWTRATVSAEM
jgi:hypothetical protein